MGILIVCPGTAVGSSRGHHNVFSVEVSLIPRCPRRIWPALSRIFIRHSSSLPFLAPALARQTPPPASQLHFSLSLEVAAQSSDVKEAHHRTEEGFLEVCFSKTQTQPASEESTWNGRAVHLGSRGRPLRASLARNGHALCLLTHHCLRSRTERRTPGPLQAPGSAAEPARPPANIHVPGPEGRNRCRRAQTAECAGHCRARCDYRQLHR